VENVSLARTVDKPFSIVAGNPGRFVGEVRRKADSDVSINNRQHSK
jgi:hypothetical protein